MLKGKTINLRTVREKDLETYLDLFSDIKARGPNFPVRMETEVSVRQSYDKNGFWSEESGMLLIVDKDSDRILGLVACFKPSRYYCMELGYILFRPEDRGKGIMTEAVRLFGNYVFDLHPFDRLQIQMETENIGSRTVAQKCGFTYEGTLKKAMSGKNGPIDIEVWSLLREDRAKLNA